METRHFDKHSNVVSCNNSVFTENPEPESFRIKEVKYYNLDDNANPATPSSGPTPDCCISKGEYESEYNKCSNFIKYKDTNVDVFKNNFCSKNATLVNEDNKWFYKCS